MTSKLVVCIDIRDLRIAKTGTKTYLEEVCKELRKGKEDFTFFFIDCWLPVYTGNSKFLKIFEHIRYFGWKQISLPIICWLKKCDILFCADYFLPLIKLNYKTAVVFHDAFFWEYPEQYNGYWLRILNFLAVPAAKKADAVITMSEYSKKQIIKYVGIDEHKIHAIHLAPKSSTAIASNWEIENRIPQNYILHIGVLEKRKNLLNLINAFNLLIQDGFEEYFLVLVGNKISKKDIDDSTNINDLIKNLDLEEKVIRPGFISDSQLGNYYKNAALYTFVSINEGFGFPVLEAFQHDLPTLIADNSCLPEIGGDAVITCNPFDIYDIKEKMKEILSSSHLKETMILKGRKRLNDFSWQKTIEKLLEVFRIINSKN